MYRTCIPIPTHIHFARTYADKFVQFWGIAYGVWRAFRHVRIPFFCKNVCNKQEAALGGRNNRGDGGRHITSHTNTYTQLPHSPRTNQPTDRPTPGHTINISISFSGPFSFLRFLVLRFAGTVHRARSRVLLSRMCNVVLGPQASARALRSVWSLVFTPAPSCVSICVCV